MRLIKYRVWDKKNKCWYKPTYEAYKGKLKDLTLTPFGELIMRSFKEGTRMEKTIHESVFPDRFEVVLFTGLKDKNRKEIYFNCSIIKPRGVGKPYVVEWNDWMILNNIESKPELYEVIGNIMENPELLK